MKGVSARLRSSPRGAVDAVVKEREPFCVGPHRAKSASPARKGRSNGENVPPDVNSKADKPKAAKISNSPALPPKFPRPSLGRNASALTQLQDKIPGCDQGSNIKRKINWDMPTGASSDDMIKTSAVETSSADSGVKVILRVRPLNKKEEAEEADRVVRSVTSTSVSLSDQQFTFDAVAGEVSSQEAVFNLVGLPMAENCLAGFNSSIFAYGQTGSGKTHTMWGVMSDTQDIPSDDRGLTSRVFEMLFARIQREELNNINKQLVYQCRCSFLEIYNEQITDLLEPSQKNLMIREDTKTGVYVENLSEEFVSSVQEVTRVLVKGLANRRVSATSMNSESSRSHCVFTCVIESRSKGEGEGISSVRSSRLNLVDLAGSERQKQTGSAGERLKEAGNINKSLSQLGNVINILAEVSQSGKHRHVPYRDSRLTFLLQESLGGNARLAMICTVSPASCCRNETLSTLRFAQRAKAIQNKAIVNEEKANDVNLLREQIRQLKEELTRMKSNTATEAGDGSGYTTGWNARRSYNLLRLSLGHPMTAPLFADDVADDGKKTDEDIESSTDEANIRLSSGTNVVQSLNMDSPGAQKSAKMKMLNIDVANGRSASSNGETALTPCKELDDTPNLESPTLGLAEGRRFSLQNVDVSRLPTDTSPNLQSPKYSYSPKGNKKSIGTSAMFGLVSLAENEDVVDFGAPVGVTRLRSAKSLPSPSPRDRLAASLQKGLQILDNHQQNSLRRSTNLRLSFQSTDPKSPQSATSICSQCSMRSSGAGSRSIPPPVTPNRKSWTKEIGVQTSPLKELTESSELANLNEVACKTMLPDSPSSSIETVEDNKGNKKEVGILKPDYVQAIQALLAGSIRRERAAEEIMTQQAAEIEQLNRLMRQYKHERECNSILQQSRQEKIVRLESLMSGVLPRESFLNEEWAALLKEHKILQEKFDKHPEVTHSKIELERLLDELDRYKTFFDLGEREVLLQENMDLRNHLQSYLDCDTRGPAKHRRLSITAKSIRESAADLSLRTAVTDGPSTPESLDTHQLANERELWQERELKWLTLMEEIQAESEKYRLLAENRRVELDGEKRCAKELQDALQLAMEGHARQLEQYAELQEKHVALLDNNRKIREGVMDLKQLAKKTGVTTTDTSWFECQAEQLVAMRIDHELQRDAARDEVRALRAQLQDTVEAVSAAGELLVRLKEAEEAMCLAQDAAAMAGQEANSIRREMERLRKAHESEIATLQQTLLETRWQKPQLCPMCVMAERVKFEFTEPDADTMAKTESRSASLHFRSLSSPAFSTRHSYNSVVDGEYTKDNYEDSIAGELEARPHFLDNLDIDEFVDEPL
ncbi:kinesin-like protein KIN-12A isoform X2 [Physcomitrium patens]|uniref:kinesin-like protein KIN-12A isoform X2 n=1 Tax=Physcomitrium patens TaxID=3218 RepID=UPI000D174F85|nr:kinesin-like protein KIN-12A isoform X2 [Physcomitrium patens]|eukprot:XP_024385375.1 kinesin-like protein KIN-12A isoform X2 [Physcomitrella patens]